MKTERTKEEIIADVLGWESFSPGPVMADTDDFLKAMEEYRQSSPGESKWVSVDERLPAPYQSVAVLFKGKGKPFMDGNETFSANCFTITHWAELPPIEEPKEK